MTQVNPETLDMPIGSKVFNVYFYKTEHQAKDVLADGYFNAVADRLKKFDLVKVVAKASAPEPDALTLLVTNVERHGTGNRVKVKEV